ncbi:D-3-phosphoglycerate dehydrogenase [Sphingobium xanthum]|uniref:phosphoglycerate dehydrogenase n=1 Tax=Sphingobium xanthum TaxID=1387165 RepID=UPI001C8C962B|nr:phosphoglycerate dehydrogenase [Sphingobium xanthum]
MEIVVCSRSFSRNPVLRSELEARCRQEDDTRLRFNDEGVTLLGAELSRFLAGAERAIIALEPVDELLLQSCSQLRVIAKYGVGLNNIHLQACADAGVQIGWTAGVNSQSVAEMCVSLMIAAQRRLFESNRNLLAGKWGQLSGPQLSASTVGIIGFGHVGQALARLLAPFGCSILINDIVDFSSSVRGSAEQVSLDELLRRSDVISLHVPSTLQTTGMIDAEAIACMRPHAVVVNTARGDIVNLGALRQALREKRIAAAAIDVFAPEPPDDAELLALPNLIATAHLGGSSDQAILAMGRAAIKGLFEFRPAREFMQYA